MRSAIAIISVLLLLVLAGCAAPPTPVEEVPAVEEIEEIAEEAEEVVEEAAAEEEAEEEVEEAAEDEEVEEALEEEDEEETEIVFEEDPAEEGVYDVKAGDEVEFEGKVVKFITASRSTGLYFEIDGYRSNVQETGNHEILLGVKVTYVNALKFHEQGKLTVKLEKFELGENEYLLEKNTNQNIMGTIFRLDDVKYDSNAKKPKAFVKFPYNTSLYEIIMMEGTTVERAGLSINLVKGYYESGNQYGIFKIVPA